MLPTTVDSTRITVDATDITVDQRGTPATRDGWPCSLLSSTPPSVADKQSAPTADDLLPAVLTLTPRGAAWGTDEAGDGHGASPVMLRFWRAIATWVADVNARDFEVATQAFPSAATIALDDWETELGLPDTCTPGQRSQEARLSALRTKYGAIGGSSPDYLICVAAALGYDIWIEEPTQALCDVSECIDGSVVEAGFYVDETGCDEPVERFSLHARPGVYGDEVAGGIVEAWFTCDDGECGGDPIEAFHDDPAGTVWKFWIVHVRRVGDTWFVPAAGGFVEDYFRVDEGEIGATPLESFALAWPDPADVAGAGDLGADPIEGFTTFDDLECVLRRACPPHTQVVFSYDDPLPGG